MEGLVKDGHVPVGWNYINMIQFHLHAIPCLNDGHFCESPDEIRHHAGMARVQMGDDDECSAGVGRHMTEKLFDGFETAGRSANPDNGKAYIRHFSDGCLMS